MSVFNSLYSFKNYVIGCSNEFAYTCAHTIAEEPGAIYNPLFIYGETGTGKTHLLNAMGLYIQEHNPDMRILYMTAEQFVKEIVDSIRVGTVEEMDKKYIEADVLMIDDVQFIAGKEATQEEFFRILDLVYSKNKQIILASDTGSHRIQDLKRRIYAQFMRGVVVELKLPNDEATFKGGLEYGKEN